MAKFSRILHIVKLHQMLRLWKKNTTSPAASHRLPSDVPAGHVAVSVGSSCRRYIVRATYLNHPIFRRLLNQAEEEYGFANYSGPLAIPCDESLFEEIISFLSRGDSDLQRRCHAGARNESSDLLAGESRPLLYGFGA